MLGLVAFTLYLKVEHFGSSFFFLHHYMDIIATISIDSGANQSSVSKALGHADVATTLRMYTHPDEEGVKIASEIFERAIEQASNG